MSTTIATGMSKGSDSGRTAEEAVDRARAKLGARGIDLVLLFASSRYDYPAVVRTVRRLTGNAPLIGSSTAGEFTEEAVGLGSIAVSLFSSDDIRFFTGLAEHIDRDAETAVGNIITQIPLDVPGYPHRCILMLTDGMVSNGEEITLLVANMAGPRTQVVGGLAADDFRMKQTVVFHNDRVAEEAAAICVMASKKPFFTAVNHGHLPLSPPMKITRAEKNVVYQVDGRPAWDVWKEHTAEAARQLGIDVNRIRESGEVAAYFSNFELGLRTGGEQYKVRYPNAINEDDSIHFTCTIPEGATICIMDGRSADRQVEASRRAAEKVRDEARRRGYETFGGAVVIECAVRQFLLGEQFHRAPEAVREVLGGIPLIGAETYGEMRFEPGEFSGYHNTTTVVLLFVQ